MQGDKGKVRIVHDASSKGLKNLYSLNDYFKPDPVFLPNLVEI